MSNNKQQIIAEFEKCPNCGSTRRFAEEVAQEEKEKGLMGDDLPVGVWEFAGPLFDPRMMNKMLVGSTVPSIRVTLDVCLDCGCLYAVRLERGEASLKSIVAQPPPGFMPPGTMGPAR